MSSSKVKGSSDILRSLSNLGSSSYPVSKTLVLGEVGLARLGLLYHSQPCLYITTAITFIDFMPFSHTATFYEVCENWI